MLKPSIIFAVGLNGALAVALGAFGAHALKPRLLETGMLSAWETAAQYHLSHAVACLGLIAWAAAQPSRAQKLLWPVIFWLLGCVFFAGSLYWMALGGPRFLGPITPVGGVFLMLAWGLVAKEAFSQAAR